jgi:hypothetical protein
LYHRRQKLVIPPTLSGSAHDFLSSFAYTGTRDYTQFCSSGAGLDFRASLGSEDEVLAYGHDLAVWAGEHLTKVWGTEVMQDKQMTGWMTNVRLPSDDAAKVGEVATRLLQDYDTKVVFFQWSAQSYTRLSAQVYLQRSDFERLGTLVLQLLAEVEVCLCLLPKLFARRCTGGSMPHCSGFGCLTIRFFRFNAALLGLRCLTIRFFI